MKKFSAVIIVFLFIISAVFPVFAHSGRTDSEGGHYNHATGEYHYHHGHSAHQHENGVCPYDFDDQTNHDGDSSSEDDDEDHSDLSTNVSNEHTSAKKEPSFWEIAGEVVAWLLIGWCGLSVLYWGVPKIINAVKALRRKD